MLYKFSSKQIGIKNIKEIAQVELEHPIIDFCVKDLNNIFFVWDKYIGHISNKKVDIFFTGYRKEYENYEDIPEINFGYFDYEIYLKPSSCYYLDLNDSIYLVENNGKILRRIDLKNKYSENIFNKNNIVNTFLNNLHKKIINIESITSIYVSDGIIYWCSNILNRVLKYNNGNIENICGNGRAGFSIFNNPNDCGLCFPIGLNSLNNNLYITDTGNNCIRYICNNFLRTINKKVEKPKFLRNIDKKLSFLENNKIKVINQDNILSDIPIYENENIINFNGFGKDIIILEKV